VKTKIRLFANIFVYVVVLGGCVGQADWDRGLKQEQQGVKSVSSSMGQRTFDTGHDITIKALINAFANKNLTVLTVEKDAGFMMAEGSQFLDNDSLQNIYKERNAQYGGVGMGKLIPNVKLRITANLYGKENNRTLIKLKINTVHQHCMVFEKGTFKKWPFKKLEENKCPPPPAMISALYKQLWAEIEKSIFMQRETILN
jgi:hypothetical protein